MVKSGFDVKVGHLDDTIVLLSPTNRIIYDVPYFEIVGQRYYANIFDKNADKIVKLKTHGGKYQEANESISVELPVLPNLGGVFVKKEYPFSYQSVSYVPNLVYNSAEVEFLETRPQTELDVYFAASLSDGTKKSLYEAFNLLVSGKSRGEALDLILRFVQTAFAYETDGEQFGYEKPLFPDQTLHFPYCDCEDRSVLFARMTDELLGLKAVGLRYPGHVAVAVRLDIPLEGDHIEVGGEDYLICDPTYINAGIGMCMPQFKGVTPEIVSF